VVETALQCGPGPRVQRGRLRSTAQPDVVVLVVDVGVGEVLEFLGGGAVEQRCQPDERLVWVHAGVAVSIPWNRGGFSYAAFGSRSCAMSRS
jgi:hypothetical protein